MRLLNKKKNRSFIWISSFAAVIGILFISSSFNTATINKNYLTVRVIEATVGSASKIVIVNEKNEKEEVALERAKPDPGINMPLITETINSISAKGYNLVSSSGGGDNYVIISTYIFEKN